MAVGVGLAPDKLPVIGEALNARNHLDGQPGHPNKVALRRMLCDRLAVDAKRCPSRPGARRAKVRATVLL